MLNTLKILPVSLYRVFYKNKEYNTINSTITVLSLNNLNRCIVLTIKNENKKLFCRFCNKHFNSLYDKWMHEIKCFSGRNKIFNSNLYSNIVIH